MATISKVKILDRYVPSLLPLYVSMASYSNGGKGDGTFPDGKPPEKGSRELAKGKCMKGKGGVVRVKGEGAPTESKGKTSLKGKGMSGKSPAALKGKAVDPPSAGKGQDLAADQGESTAHGKGKLGKSLMKGKGAMKGKGKGKVLEKGVEKPESPREIIPPSEETTKPEGKGKAKGKGKKGSAGKKGTVPGEDIEPPKENMG